MSKLFFRFNLVRLAFFQMGFGIMLGFLEDTLNRVMTSDLGISSTIVFGLISLKELLAVFGVKVWAGNMSDSTSIMGYKRTPFIFLGLSAFAIAFALSPSTAYEVQIQHQSGDLLSMIWFALNDFALIKLVVIFLTIGFGLQVATTTYYALVSDYVGERNIGKVASSSWTLMVLTTILTAKSVGIYLEEYSPERLSNVAQFGGAIAFIIGFLSVVGVEKRNNQTDKKSSEQGLSFGQSIQLLSGSPKTMLFAFYIFLSIFALFANVIVMEPFGADVFGMSVSETNSLFRPTMGGMQLIFMLIVGFFITKTGKKLPIYIGNTLSSIGFAMVIYSGIVLDATFLKISLVVVGIGLGASSIANITMMMTMTAGRAGIYMGLWGTAQSLAMFLGNSGAGVVRDIMISLSGDFMPAYTVIFAMEILAFTSASLILPHISKEKFETESKVKMEEMLAASGVD